MKRILIGLLLTGFLGISTISVAEHGIPEAVVEGDIVSVRVADDPELATIAKLVEQEYNRLSTSPVKYQFPMDLSVAIISGQTARSVGEECECIGRTAFQDSQLHGVFVLLGISNYGKLDIVAHEFTHVMQQQAGLLKAMPRELAEDEAEVI